MPDIPLNENQCHGADLPVRTYGTSGPFVIVVHGGPGAPGYLAPLARGLAGSYRILEPFQRGSGSEPLTVARHISDLDEMVTSRCGSGGDRDDARLAVVGHSWGAMLALAHAAAHPGRAACIVLIGCGTFDPAARQRLQSNIEKRLDAETRERIRQLPDAYPDRDQRLEALGNLLLPLYSFNLLSSAQETLETEGCDARAHEESWADMVRLQDQGVYPAAFSAIKSPVLMLHGRDDPHPGRMIRERLMPLIPHLEYREWDRCGHYPWLERALGDQFFDLLGRWLAEHLHQG